MKTTLLILSALALTGCNVVPWVAAHKAELAAIGAIAGTAQVTLGAFNQADEAAHRLERRIQTDKE